MEVGTPAAIDNTHLRRGDRGAEGVEKHGNVPGLDGHDDHFPPRRCLPGIQAYLRSGRGAQLLDLLRPPDRERQLIGLPPGGQQAA